MTLDELIDALGDYVDSGKGNIRVYFYDGHVSYPILEIGENHIANNDIIILSWLPNKLN